MLFRKWHVFALLLTWLTAFQAMAVEQAIVRDNSPKQMPLKPLLYQWVGDEKPIEELIPDLSLFSYWTPAEKAASNLGKKTLRANFTLLNLTDEHQELLITHSEPMIDHFRVIVVQGGKILQSYEAGNKHSFSSRPFPHQSLVFPVAVDPDQQVTVLIEVEGLLDDFYNELELWDRQAFFERTNIQPILLAFYWGALFLLICLMLYLRSNTHSISYLWFTLFCLATLIRSMAMQNLLFEYIWPETPALQNIVIISSIMVGSFFLALFVISYFQLQKGPSKLHRAFQIYLALHVLFLLYQIFAGWSIASMALWFAISFMFSFVILGVAIWKIRTREHGAIHFAVCFGLLIFLGLLAAGNQLFNFGLAFNFQAEMGEMIFLFGMAIALIQRVDELREMAHFTYAKDKAKNDFMAKMSHEIRTPINGVLGMAQLLSETPLSRKQQHYADVINHCSKTLLNVVNDILEYSRIEAGKLEFEHTSFVLDELLSKNNDLFWPQIKNKGINYRYWLDPNIPNHFIGDPTRIQQILNNLFSNAIKFTDHGYIGLEVRLISTNGKNAKIEFRLKDTGIGMSTEELDKVFAPFTQARTSTNRLYGGSGLGLNITRQLVQLLGGDIHVDSQLKLGTEFTITLPLEVDEKPSNKSSKAAQKFAGKHALILSPELPGHDPAQTLLRTWGLDITCFSDVNEALMASHNSLDEYDIICIACDVLSDINHQEKLALRDSHDRILIYDFSFSLSPKKLPGYEKVHKLLAPFSYKQLQENIYDILGLMQKKTSEDDGSESFKTRSDLNILVAEDDATNRLVIRAVLKKLHIEHEIVTNGLLATERYAQAPDKFDMILMDCEMPEMDGYEAASTIREFEQQQHIQPIPIVALTAHVLPEFEQRCIDSGMNQVIAKPIHVHELTAAFEKYCAEKR